MTGLEEATDEPTRNKMSSVRQSGTSPELAVRAALGSLGFEFGTNIKDMPGSPDIWLTQTKTPIFVHGCFWHRHQGCKNTTTPKRNRSFWVEKFKKNIERDNKNVQSLKALGYAPVIVWQCETLTESRLKDVLLSRICEATI